MLKLTSTTNAKGCDIWLAEKLLTGAVSGPFLDYFFYLFREINHNITHLCMSPVQKYLTLC